MNWKEKREMLISQLPTIIDILEEIALSEEAWHLNKSSFRRLFPNHYQEGMFDLIKMPDETCQLWPISLGINSYYRGQSSYYSKCYPSLLRPNMKSSDVFAARLRTCEFKLLMQTYPMWDIFQHNVQLTLPDKNTYPIVLSCDALALAQHYGFPTELLDLTVDKWVAAFFACTNYDAQNDTYNPTDETDGYGVFYSYSNPISFSRKPGLLRAVGLQPFSRPGEQAGYVLKMHAGQNFNKMCFRKVKFRHDSKASQLVFNFTNRSKKLFPHSPLEDKAAIIRTSSVISEPAFQMAKEQFFNLESKEQLSEWLKESGLQIVDHPIVSFSEQEKQQFFKQWKENKKRFFRQIYVRARFQGPIKMAE